MLSVARATAGEAATDEAREATCDESARARPRRSRVPRRREASAPPTSRPAAKNESRSAQTAERRDTGWLVRKPAATRCAAEFHAFSASGAPTMPRDRGLRDTVHCANVITSSRLPPAPVAAPRRRGPRMRLRRGPLRYSSRRCERGRARRELERDADLTAGERPRPPHADGGRGVKGSRTRPRSPRAGKPASGFSAPQDGRQPPCRRAYERSGDRRPRVTRTGRGRTARTGLLDPSGGRVAESEWTTTLPALDRAVVSSWSSCSRQA